MNKRIIILGSTGSIGRSALDVLDGLGDRFTVAALAARRNWETIAEQAHECRPEAVAIAEESRAHALRDRLPDSCRVLSGGEALVDLVRQVECDLVLAAVVGAAGLPATLAAVERGRAVALANKETMVMAGELVTRIAGETGARLLPVDSEHSAIFQALHCGRREEVSRIYLTASGGPFRTWPAEKMARATLEDALQHPVWRMGHKVTIDSATMMNKALEVIEARWLFDIPAERIQVLIHPESIVHSMVEFRDGSVIAQLGIPDMRTPIQYALTYPARLEGRSEHLDMLSLKTMHFEPPDPARFPALTLGHEAARLGGTTGAVLNAANEIAVEAFTEGRLAFGDIIPLVRSVLDDHEPLPDPDLAALMEADRGARGEARKRVEAGLGGS